MLTKSAYISFKVHIRTPTLSNFTHSVCRVELILSIAKNYINKTGQIYSLFPHCVHITIPPGPAPCLWYGVQLSGHGHSHPTPPFQDQPSRTCALSLLRCTAVRARPLTTHPPLQYPTSRTTSLFVLRCTSVWARPLTPHPTPS